MAITSPRDIPGCLIWCSAEAETAYANGDGVTTWHDNSGNANHLAGGGNPPIYQTSGGGGASGRRIRFNGLPGQIFTVPSSAWSGKTALWVYMAVRVDDADSQRSLMSSTGAGGFEHYGYSDGNVYENFMANTRRSWPIPHADNTWHRYAVASASNWQAWFNGTSQLGPVVSTFQLPPTATDFFLGGGYQQMVGDLGLFCLFDHFPTSTERADMDAWAAANMSGGILLQTINVNRASATDSAQSIQPPQNISIGRASTSSTARAIRRLAKPFNAEDINFDLAVDLSTAFDTDFNTHLAP